MDKIYGFKANDIEKLIRFLNKRSGQSLSQIFSDYATISGKSKGTIRNMYYAVARKSREDKDFTEKYLGGKQISVQSVAAFNSDEEKQLIERVLEGKKNGESVRSVINKMACGDAKLALRYQNKYRNALKNKKGLVAEVAAELKYNRADEQLYEVGNNYVSKIQIKKLQSEINGLLERLTGKLKRENEYLKMRLNKVEIENLRLKKTLYGEDGEKNTAEYFKKQIDKNVLS